MKKSVTNRTIYHQLDVKITQVYKICKVTKNSIFKNSKNKSRSFIEIREEIII